MTATEQQARTPFEQPANGTTVRLRAGCRTAAARAEAAAYGIVEGSHQTLPRLAARPEGRA